MIKFPDVLQPDSSFLRLRTYDLPVDLRFPVFPAEKRSYHCNSNIEVPPIYELIDEWVFGNVKYSFTQGTKYSYKHDDAYKIIPETMKYSVNSTLSIVSPWNIFLGLAEQSPDSSYTTMTISGYNGEISYVEFHRKEGLLIGSYVVENEFDDEVMMIIDEHMGVLKHRYSKKRPIDSEEQKKWILYGSKEGYEK